MNLINGRIPTVVTQDEMIFVAMENGTISCKAILFDSSYPVSQVANSLSALEADEKLFCENGEVLQMNFRPQSLLYYLIEGHALHGDRKMLDKDVKPCIDQLKKELQSMLDEIDGLSYQ